MPTTWGRASNSSRNSCPMPRSTSVEPASETIRTVQSPGGTAALAICCPRSFRTSWPFSTVRRMPTEGPSGESGG